MNSQHQPCTSLLPLSTMYGRQLQSHQYEGDAIDVSVAMLFFLLLVCCTLLCVPVQVQWSRRIDRQRLHSRHLRDHERRRGGVQQQHHHHHHRSRTSRPEELTMQQAQAIAAEAAVLQYALQQMLGVGFDGGFMDEPSLNYRRDYIRNSLMTKRVHLSSGKIIKDTTDNEENANDDAAAALCEPSQRQQSRTHVILNTALNQVDDVADNGEEETTTTSSLETCPICLCAYEENDEISWSHNNACRHLFHRQCIEKWLLHHEECPCCRSVFLLDVHNDEMIHNSHNGDAPSASPRNNSERPNGRQPSSSSSSPISIADSSMNHRHDESPSEESSRNLARGMAFFYRHVASRRHAQSPTNVPTAHASTISRTIISSNHVEEMTLPPSPNATLQATTSVALEENLDESPFSTVHHHDEPALSSTIEVTVATTVDDIGRECGTARAAPVSNIEHVNDNSPSDEVVCSVEEGRALPADELSC